MVLLVWHVRVNFGFGFGIGGVSIRVVSWQRFVRLVDLSADHLTAYQTAFKVGVFRGVQLDERACTRAGSSSYLCASQR